MTIKVLEYKEFKEIIDQGIFYPNHLCLNFTKIYLFNKFDYILPKLSINFL